MPSRRTEVPLEVEFDQHGDRFPADDPAVVARVDRDDLRSSVLDDAAVRVLDVDLAAGEKPDVGVHAQIGADQRLHVHRPAESGRVDHALDARAAGAADLEPDTADRASFGALHRRREGIERLGPAPNDLALAMFRRFLFRHGPFSVEENPRCYNDSASPVDLAVPIPEPGDQIGRSVSSQTTGETGLGGPRSVLRRR
jgi:hypothetical protein